MDIFDKHYTVFCKTAEFVMLPLHWLAVAHQYAAATTIGSIVMCAYIFATLRQARLNKMVGITVE